ncbi:hypothetical protein D3C78_1673320 [compost metagenome]
MPPADFPASVWKKRSNMCERSFSEIPIPLSETSVTTLAPSGYALTVIRPPSGVNFTALDKRFVRI